MNRTAIFPIAVGTVYIRGKTTQRQQQRCFVVIQYTATYSYTIIMLSHFSPAYSFFWLLEKNSRGTVFCSRDRLKGTASLSYE